jgi:ribonuclease HII
VIDGKFTIPDFFIDQEAVIDGDNKILSIAAASIIAKVYRDDLMRKLHLKYPIYNFAQHKGYGTLFHRTMILQNGLSPIHRKSFCRAVSPLPLGEGQG